MKSVAKDNLNQLKSLLSELNENQYRASLDILSRASIGKHIRHILDLYLQLIDGARKRRITYDDRNRDVSIEIDIDVAIQKINQLIIDIDNIDEQEAVKFESDYSITGESPDKIMSSVARELAYCIEHSIHHQALIKAALITLGLRHLVDNNFGVAYSTIRHRDNTCAQ
ncbi:DinB family protein [Saccharicrinis aurantiacus]|uniref:DinB family protein n=1 Tax=Saccharicrinis aurantiacus TaxID=1849719 RepID=UPI0008383D5E|nr:DinB family protein [Saccharicrinis aurantiacus]